MADGHAQLSALLRVLHELGVEARAEAVRHHAFDDARDLGLRITFAVDETDRHALVGLPSPSTSWSIDALDLAMDRERLAAARDEQLEQELGADRKRAARLDERAAARDVLGVVGEERVEPLVFDLELDRTPRRRVRVGSLASLSSATAHSTRITADERQVFRTRAIRRMAGAGGCGSGSRCAVRSALGSGFVPLFGVLGFELALVAARRSRRSAGLDLGAALARELQWMRCARDRRARSILAGARARLRCGVAARRRGDAVPAVIAAVRGIWVADLRLVVRHQGVCSCCRSSARRLPGRSGMRSASRSVRGARAEARSAVASRSGVPVLGARGRAIARGATAIGALVVGGVRRGRRRRRVVARRAASQHRRSRSRLLLVIAVVGLYRFYARAAGVHVQRDPRLLPRQPVRRERPARHAAACGRASSSSRGWSRSSRSSRRGSTCRAIA